MVSIGNAQATIRQDADVAKPVSAEVLEEAMRVIHADRAESYGSAEESFARIAQLWSAYLSNHPVSAHDVAMMMVLLKVSRAKTDKGRDSYVDIAGYGALGGRLA